MPKRSAHKKAATASWKSVQSQQKRAKKTKLALLVLSLVIVSIFSGKLLFFVTSFQKPLTADQSLYNRHYSWSGQANLNLVIKGRQVEVLSFNPIEKKVVIVKLPDETYLPVFNRGNWKLSSIYDLGQSEKVPKGKLMLKDSLSWFLGLPIDGFFQLPSSLKDKGAADLVEILRKNPPQAWSLLPSLETDLNIMEVLRLWVSVSQVRFDKVEVMDLAKLNLVSPTTLADGTPVLVGDPNQVDSLAPSLVESNITSERIPIAIFNGTDIPGLAQKAQRLITNLGGNVIITSNAQHKVKHSAVVGLKSQTLTRLRQVFNLDCQEGPKCDMIEDQEVKSSRAQINVVVGEDFLKVY